MWKYIAIWLGAACVYGAFWLWHSAPRPPLSPAEITEQLAVYGRLYESGKDAARRVRLRGFLSADDGGEVFMIHLVRMRARPEPVEGERIALLSSFDMLRKYTDVLIWPLYVRASYPLWVADGGAGELEAWGIEAPIEWTHIALVRHRSRRDLMELALDPDFAARHRFAVAAMETQLAFSLSSPQQLLMLKPPIVMAWIIFALAALAHMIAAFQDRPQRSQTSTSGSNSGPSTKRFL